MAPRSVDRDERRAHILQAALRVFARQGYSYTVVEDVAQEAGISKGTIYLYFDSKDELVLAAFELFEEQMEAETDHILASEKPPLEKLRALGQRFLDLVTSNEALERVLLDLWVAGLHNENLPQIDFKRLYSEYRALVRRLLEEAIAEGTVRDDLPPHAPSVVLAAVDGIVLQWLMDPEAVPIDRMGEQVMDTLFKGLRREKTT